MAKFITGQDLETTVYDIIWEAKDTLLIVSPFIKLDNYFKELFDKHTNHPQLHLIIVFGKNVGEVSKSLSKSDIDYFTKFMNVSIVYVPNLHAKYYGNEKKGIITSINLYDFSFKNNIEYGVFSETFFLSNFPGTTDQDAWNTSMKLALENEAIYIKRPVFEKKLLSSIIGRNYIKSDVLHDIRAEFYKNFSTYKQSGSIKRLKDFPAELDLGAKQTERPERDKPANELSGYCIRTGDKIPFNPERPYSIEAYRSWAYWSNVDFPEKYCHKTGKLSYGKTSMRNPILK